MSTHTVHYEYLATGTVTDCTSRKVFIMYPTAYSMSKYISVLYCMYSCVSAQYCMSSYIMIHIVLYELFIQYNVYNYIATHALMYVFSQFRLSSHRLYGSRLVGGSGSHVTIVNVTVHMGLSRMNCTWLQCVLTRTEFVNNSRTLGHYKVSRQ